MKLFADKELTKPIEDLDFGIVDAGVEKKIVFYLHNESTADTVEIKPIVDNVEVSIVSHPTELKSKETGKIEFSWTPALNVKKGLTASLKINCYELYS
jgi:hypothetical protein